MGIESSYSRREVALLGFATLVLELAVIRWVPAYVIFLQFFTNVMLVGAFLGLAIGAFSATSGRQVMPRFHRILLYVLLLSVSVSIVYHALPGVAIDGALQGGVVFFGFEDRPIDVANLWVPIEIVCALAFFGVALLFVGLGQMTGRYFNLSQDRLSLYFWHSFGGLCGVLLFTGFSLLEFPPFVWFATALLALCPLIRREGVPFREYLIFSSLALLLVGVTGASPSNSRQQLWSPYYRIEFNSQLGAINVNTMAHQVMSSALEGRGLYDIPYRMPHQGSRPKGPRVLIVGAGSGNDVAYALKSGASEVHAVEIDPVISRLGRQYHPDRPYSDPRVRVITDDGRHYLRTTSERYDIVVYALVDSLVLQSGFSSVRLESFLFTREAFSDVQRVLSEDGLFVVYNLFRQGWVAHRLADSLERVFGHRPVVLSSPRRETIGVDDELGASATVFLQSSSEKIVTDFPTAILSPDIGLTRLVGSEELGTATDDWPFLYVRERGIPLRPYVTGTLLMMLTSLALYLLIVGREGRGARGAFPRKLAFLSLGAAFILLETVSIVRLSLVFGSTWIVSSFVFASIMLLILGSTWVSRRYPNSSAVLWAIALVVSSIVSMILLPLVAGGGGGAAKLISPFLALVPIFFSGVVFGRLFASSTTPHADYSWNIFGAILGAWLEIFSLAVGFTGIMALVLLFYLMALVSLWVTRDRAPLLTA